jgi:hypothetical protein
MQCILRRIGNAGVGLSGEKGQKGEPGSSAPYTPPSIAEIQGNYSYVPLSIPGAPGQKVSTMQRRAVLMDLCRVLLDRKENPAKSAIQVRLALLDPLV